MSDRYGHKQYQNDTLSALRSYLRDCRESRNPEKSFITITANLHNVAHPYNRVHQLENGAEMPQDMPFVCLRVPTGGGKTVIGARSIRVFKDELLDAEYPLVLWLVPSDAIRSQTVKIMRDRAHALRQLLEEELGAVEILDASEALTISPATISGNATIIVSTIQAFRVENTDGRRVYGNNGALMPHFDGISQATKAQFPRGFPHSLANVLRLRRPFVVVDEAQNARSELSMQVLERFQPKAILELTATPVTDAKSNPSNVLFSVSAAELKAAQMIKLPIVLEAQTGFKEVMASAVAMRGELEKEAELERTATSEYIRPILLLQAEPHSQERPDALTVEVLEKTLREEYFVPEAQLAVHTGIRRDLEGKDLNREDCPVRYVVTQSALKEGWDCPFAYVLCSVANLSSATAVEQILGRILRMPNAELKQRPALNRAYAFVRSPNFFVAANLLRDQLVKNSGFDEREAREFFVQRERQQTLDLEAKGRRSVTVILPESMPVDSLPTAARLCVVKHNPQTREVTLTGHPTKAAVEAMLAVVEKEESKEILRAAAAELNQHERIMVSPAERGERFEVPQMMLELDGEIMSPDEAEWLAAGWHLPLPPTEEDFPALDLAKPSESVGIVDVEDGKVITRRMPELANELQLIEVQENWNQTRLVTWLDRNIPHIGIEQDEFCAYLDGVLSGLQSKLPLGRLVQERFELRRKIEARGEVLKKAAQRREYQRVLFGTDSQTKVRVGAGYVFAYDPNSYPLRESCTRSREFVNHYYEQVGNLDDKGQEFNCAMHIDGLADVQWWVRNLERQPVHSFSLQTSTDRFYPDFVCKLKCGKILVVEYKAADWGNEKDNDEKERLGNLWAEHSGGQCYFLMVKGPGELSKISEAITNALAATAK